MKKQAIGKLFHSLELEGELRGTNTLFVENCVPTGRILEVLEEQHHFIEHVYFGAVYMGEFGQPSEIDDRSVLAVLKRRPVVTVEVLAHDSHLHFHSTWLDIPGVRVLVPGPALTGLAAVNWFNVIESRHAFDRVQVKWESARGIYTVKLSDAFITRKALYQNLDKGTLL